MASQKRQARFVDRLARQVGSDVPLARVESLFQPAVSLLPPGPLKAALEASIDSHRAKFLSLVRASRYVLRGCGVVLMVGLALHV